MFYTLTHAAGQHSSAPSAVSCHGLMMTSYTHPGEQPQWQSYNNAFDGKEETFDDAMPAIANTPKLWNQALFNMQDNCIHYTGVTWRELAPHWVLSRQVNGNSWYLALYCGVICVWLYCGVLCIVVLDDLVAIVIANTIHISKVVCMCAPISAMFAEGPQASERKWWCRSDQS